MTIPLIPESLVKIIDTIDKRDNQSALLEWSNYDYSKRPDKQPYCHKNYPEYYPVIIETTEQQIKLAKEICEYHEINLDTLLLDLFMNFTNDSIIESLINKQIDNNINQYYPNYKKKLLTIDIHHPATYLKSLLSTMENNNPTKKQKEEHKNKADKIKSISHKYVKQEIKKMKKYEKENYQKYLIIFSINEKYNYNYLRELDYKLNKYHIANIDDIFAKLIYYLTLNTDDEDFNFQYKINNNANLIDYENWLIEKENEE